MSNVRNVTLWRVPVTTVATETQQFVIFFIVHLNVAVNNVKLMSTALETQE